MKIDEINCWTGYKKQGTKKGTGKNKGKRVNNCVKEEMAKLLEPLEEDWFDIYKQYTDIDDVTKANLKDIYKDAGYDNFDPDDKDHVQQYIDHLAKTPEHLDWYAKNYGGKLDKFSQGAAEIGYDWNAGGIRDKMIARGIDRDEIGKLYGLKDMVKKDYPDAYDLIRQGKGAEAWELLKNK